MKKFWIKIAILMTALLLVCAADHMSALDFVSNCTTTVEEKAH